jgi:hypothetical protein
VTHLDAAATEQPTEVAHERVGHLVLVRRAERHRELAPDAIGRLEDDDVVSSGARLGPAARPAGPAPTTTTLRGCADRTGRGSVSSRPVRGFCPQAIGVPAW